MSQNIIFRNYEELRFVLKTNKKIVDLAKSLYTGNGNFQKDIEKITTTLLERTFTQKEKEYIQSNRTNSDKDGEILDCLMDYSNELGPMVSMIRNVI